MKLHAQLLREGEGEGAADGLVGIIKKAKSGYDDAKKRKQDAESKRKSAEKEVENSQKEATKKAEAAIKAEKDLEKKSAKEAEKAQKEAEKQHTLTTAESLIELGKDIETFTNEFFDRFPFHGGAGGAEDILDKYPTREAAKAAFKAFKGLSERLTQLRTGMNNGLISAGKVTKDQIKRYEQQAQRLIAGSGTPAMPKALINFVRTESKFFKRLMKVDKDFQLEGDEFKDLMAVKIKQTTPERVPDAAQALNMLFIYMADEFLGHAKVIASVGRTLKDESKVTPPPPK